MSRAAVPVIPVVQFGTSRFLQAHVDLFLHEAGDGPVTVVASSGSAAGRARAAAFGNSEGYPVIVRGLENGVTVDRTVQVKSIARGLDADADWAEVVRIVTNEARFLVSNTTEGGFHLPAGTTVDLAGVGAPPPYFPARLLALLSARHRAGGAPLTVLPTELVGRNGDTLRSVVLALAEASAADAGLLDYIAERCIFANSLVDRIVSAPIDPVGAVAEPYALWAIERAPGLVAPCHHPAIRLVDDLEPVERLKIHILNLGHTVLADHWMSRNLDPAMTVRVLLDMPEAAELLRAVYDEEVLPGFAARGMGEEAAAYRATTVERFRNPFLDHRLSDIAKGHADKIQRRLQGFIDWVAPAGAAPTSRLQAVIARAARTSAT